jgi:hypothetical protein
VQQLNGDRQDRLATNQALFREVNERIRELADHHATIEPAQLELVCECSNERCAMLIPIALTDYEKVRAHPARFVIYPGHEIREIEKVVELTAAYEVVEKFDEAAEVVTALDPRSDDSQLQSSA